MGSCSSKTCLPRVRKKNVVGDNTDDRTTSGSIRVNYYKRPGTKLHPRDKIALSSLLLHLKQNHESFVLSCHIDKQNGRILWIYDDLIPPLASLFVSYPSDRAIDFEPRDVDCVRDDFDHIGSQEFDLSDPRVDLMDPFQQHRWTTTIGFPFLFAIILSEPLVAYDFFSWMEEKTAPYCTFLCFKPRLDVDAETIKNTLGVLGNLDPVFARRLRQLSFIGNFESMNEAQLYTLFAKILPNLPELEKLSLADIDLGALQGMLRNMMAVDPLLPSAPGEDDGATRSRDPMDARELLLEDLKLFQTIDSLWSSCRDGNKDQKDNPPALSRDVELQRALTTDRASVGRKDDSSDDQIGDRASAAYNDSPNDKTSANGDQCPPPIGAKHDPCLQYRLSAWPLVLSRVLQLENSDEQQRILIDKRDMLSAMYHVLREGPVLLPRCDRLDGNPSPERTQRIAEQRAALARAKRRKERRARNLELFLKVIGFIDWNESLVPLATR